MSSKAHIEDGINQRIANTEKLFNATEKKELPRIAKTEMYER